MLDGQVSRLPWSSPCGIGSHLGGRTAYKQLCVCVFSIKYKNRLASFGKSLDMQRIGFPCHEERIEECNSKVFDVVLCSQKRTSSFISSTLDIPRVPNFAHHPWVHQPPDTRKWYSGSEPEKDNLPGEWHERLDPLQISGCRFRTELLGWSPKN